MVAVLSGEIDHHCARPMRVEIDEMIEQVQPTVLILDFGGVTFMDSSGIGILIGRKKTMDMHAGKVTAVNIFYCM